MDTLYNLMKRVYINDWGINGVDEYDAKEFDSVLSNNEKARDLIVKYLGKNGKEVLFEVPKTLPTNKSSRFNHILVCYYLGRLILNYSNLNKLINENYFFGNRQNEYSLKELWMLTALFHDYGYFRNDEDNDKKPMEYDELVNSSIFKDNIVIAGKDIDVNGIKKLYTKEEIVNYYYYKSNILCDIYNYNEKIDHGIYGGIRIYEKYVNTLAKKINHQNVDSFVNDFCFHSDNLIYSKNILKEFREICWAVMCHNIYKAKSDDNLARDYLVKFPNNYDFNFKINMNKNPLDFLLGIVDTLEYTKRLCIRNGKFIGSGELSPINISKNITLDVSNNEIKIGYSSLLNIIEHNGFYNNFRRYIYDIFSLNDWIDINLNFDKSNVQIALGQNGNYEKNSYDIQNIFNEFVICPLYSSDLIYDNINEMFNDEEKDYLFYSSGNISAYYDALITSISCLELNKNNKFDNNEDISLETRKISLEILKFKRLIEYYELQAFYEKNYQHNNGFIYEKFDIELFKRLNDRNNLTGNELSDNTKTRVKVDEVKETLYKYSKN